ncbi:MAG: hypothetical protein CVU00_03120 [Bacteroidetes bacterium HGW-Bacteroidetes-17]|jgi:hypothetical protein|nr:MAG: hypothetical protein CVU00_03120 [Bacteroidetes bacterium HGW-Bacteroidetes-17]
MDNTPLVSIITVNYNRLQDTIELLESLGKIYYSNIELILIDNGSDDDLNLLERKFSNLKLIKNKKNLGFAAANNIGIKLAKGKYILLINNDVIVTPEFLTYLVQKLEQDQSIGIVSPKIYYYYKPNMIQYAGFTDINPITIRNKGIGFNELESGKYDEEKETYYAHGAAFLFRTELIKKIGFMSEIFFLYYEEMDWCKRVRNNGYKIYYIPRSIIYHKDSATTGADSPMKSYYLNRGRLIYMRRNVKFPLLILSSLYQVLFAFPKNYLRLLVQKKWTHAQAYKNAFIWFYRHFFFKNIN